MINDEDDQEPAANYHLLSILTPSGRCPIALKSTDPEAVWSWADAVRSYGFSNGRFYTVRAIHYWVRDFYDINTSDHAAVCALIT